MNALLVRCAAYILYVLLCILYCIRIFSLSLDLHGNVAFDSLDGFHTRLFSARLHIPICFYKKRK